MKKFGEFYKSSEGMSEAETSGEISAFAVNDKVKIKGVKGEWYFLGGGDKESLVSNLSDTPENINKAKISKWVKTSDLERTE